MALQFLFSTTRGFFQIETVAIKPLCLVRAASYMPPMVPRFVVFKAANVQLIKPKPTPSMVQQRLLQSLSDQSLRDKHGYLMNSVLCHELCIFSFSDSCNVLFF